MPRLHWCECEEVVTLKPDPQGSPSMSHVDIPAGFAPIFRTSPFLETIGPLYSAGSGVSLVIGMRVQEKHTNARGTLHLSLIHISEPTRLLSISYAVFC